MFYTFSRLDSVLKINLIVKYISLSVAKVIAFPPWAALLILDYVKVTLNTLPPSSSVVNILTFYFLLLLLWSELLIYRLFDLCVLIGKFIFIKLHINRFSWCGEKCMFCLFISALFDPCLITHSALQGQGSKRLLICIDKLDAASLKLHHEPDFLSAAVMLCFFPCDCVTLCRLFSRSK